VAVISAPPPPHTRPCPLFSSRYNYNLNFTLNEILVLQYFTSVLLFYSGATVPYSSATRGAPTPSLASYRATVLYRTDGHCTVLYRYGYCKVLLELFW
jgi:hypothetical protein